MNSNFPKVRINKVGLTENVYVDQDGCVYSVSKLIQHAKGLPVFEVPLAAMGLRLNAWSIEDLDDFIHHMRRCLDADTKHPIILDQYGEVADGLHRIAKSIVMGETTIKAVRLETMPDYDRVEEEEQ